MDVREVSISLDQAGPGWWDCTLNVGTQRFVLNGASYNTDVGDLIRAALQISTGGTLARVSFDGEPTELRLVLLAHEPALFVRVLEFANFYDDAVDEVGREVFKAECDLEAFAQSVLDAATSVLRDVRPDGKIWWSGEPFPIRAFQALQAALATPTTEVPPASAMGRMLPSP